MSYHVPTILIGLGGIGSQIANKIYGKIPEHRREKVAIHAFDTDVNSILSLDHLKKNVTQTSTKHSVGEYLAQNEQLLEWFPPNPHLKRRTMENGAGQVRAISRLAFRSALDEGKLNAMWDGIERIFPVDSDAKSYGVRVIIISSLVGGTGSGIFLQVALYLREMLERKLRTESVLIRGAFLLPDIFVRSNTLDQTQWEAVQANGYASLKELNAITLSASATKQQHVTIELEYRPNQVDLEGRQTHAITERHLPYDFSFLYDYENTKGQHLNNVSEYLDQVARTVYLQLFSPISARSFSQEDNQIRNLIESSGTARYCGAGVSSLTYPYDDIVEYCALKWSVNGLDDSWLLLDERFSADKKKYEQDQLNGIASDRPEIRERYVTYFHNFANDPEKPNSFFKQIDLQVHEIEDKGKKGAVKSDLFIQHVENYVQQMLDDDIELKEEFERPCTIDDGKLKLKDQARREINRVENALQDYSIEIQKKINELTQIIAYQIIDDDYRSPSGGEGHHYRLNTWMLQKDRPIHPVGVRYLLYRIYNELLNYIAELKEENQRMKDSIDRYEFAYDVDERDEIVEDAVRRVDMALNKGFLSSVFKNHFKDFIDEYRKKASSQLSTLNRYKYKKLLENVLTSVNQQIRLMISDWERFFHNLKDTRNTFLTEIQLLGSKYEGISDKTKVFVLANQSMFEKIWERVSQTIDKGILPDDISRKIYRSLYKHYIELKVSRGKSEFIQELKVEHFYRENVLKFCREELISKYNDKLDLSVIQALKLEAFLTGEDPNQYVFTKIQSLDQLAQPFIPYTNKHREIKLWGLHTQNSHLLTEQQKNNLFNEKQIEDDAFSKYEIICYRAHYGLTVSDFDKFSSNKKNYRQGVYYEAYHRLISRLKEDETRTLTPHLDSRWHLPAYMPDLNPEQVELETNRTDRALLIGIIYGWLKIVSSDGIRVYQYSGTQGTKLILKSGEKVREETYLLHEALPHNPVIYDEILKRYVDIQEHQKRTMREIQEHDFYKGALDVSCVRREDILNILDVVLHYDQESAMDPILTENADRLRKCLLLEIVTYYSKLLPPDSAKRGAAEFIRRLWNESYVRRKTSPVQEEYSKWRNDIENIHYNLTREKIYT